MCRVLLVHAFSCSRSGRSIFVGRSYSSLTRNPHKRQVFRNGRASFKALLLRWFVARSCLLAPGSCPHVDGFAAFWNIDAYQNDIVNANPDGEAAAADVSIIAANCSAESRCLGFNSIGGATALFPAGPAVATPMARARACLCPACFAMVVPACNVQPYTHHQTSHGARAVEPRGAWLSECLPLLGCAAEHKSSPTLKTACAGFTKYFLAVLTYNSVDIDPVVYCTYLRLPPLTGEAAGVQSKV